MRVLLVAEESAGVQTLQLLAARELELVGVMSSADVGRGTSVASVARRLGLELLDPALVRRPEFGEEVRARGVDVLLNVHSLHVVHANVVSAPRIGAWNLHPGPLPTFAGLNAPSWAIFEQRRRHAVTVHRMTAGIDAGPVAYEAWFDIAADDTGLRVAAACVRAGVPLLAKLLDDAARGPDHVPARPQETTGRRWFGRSAPFGGRLPWELPARRVAALVRAADYAPFPSPWGTPTAMLDGRSVAVQRAVATTEPAGVAPGTVGSPREAGVPVAAADAWVLVQRVRVDGEPVPVTDALRAGATFKLEPYVGASPAG